MHSEALVVSRVIIVGAFLFYFIFGFPEGGMVSFFFPPSPLLFEGV